MRKTNGYKTDLAVLVVGIALVVLALVLACPASAGVQLVTRPITTVTAVTTVININTATSEQLAYLPGVGIKLAERIISYRTVHGPFVRVADLRHVKGFGGDGKLLAKVAPYAMVDGPTTATTKIKVPRR